MPSSMSVERSLEAWEEVQRHGQDLADRLTQRFTDLLQSTHVTAPPPFSWSSALPNPMLQYPFDHLAFPSSKSRDSRLFSAINDSAGIRDGVSVIFDIGNRLGQASAKIGACLDEVVQRFYRHVPLPFRSEKNVAVGIEIGDTGIGVESSSSREDDEMEWRNEEMETSGERYGEHHANLELMAGYEEVSDDDDYYFAIDDAKGLGYFRRPQGSINITSTYDSRTRDIESSLIARGDLWRVEASGVGSFQGNQQSPFFLVQLGPVLFVRDTTLLLPVHLSEKHLLWYGYDRKNGVHSLCPAVWSKHRRWLSMSMISFNPLSCSFLDLQFPNGQLTYVAGEGLTTSAFLPILGGLLQVQGQYPGETRFSFTCKNKWGTRITPTVQWPDKSFTLGLAQVLAWERSGLLYRPTFQFSISPTFGGSNAGIRSEFIHCLKEKLSLICGCAYTVHPSAYASVAIGRSKWNGSVGTSGMVVRVDSPLSSVGRPSISIQLNSGLDF